MLNESIHKNHKIADKIFSFLVTILVFTFQYASPISGIALGEFLLIPFIVLFLLSDLYNRDIRISLTPWFFLLFAQILTTLFAAFSPHFVFNDTATLLLRLIFYSVLFLVGKKHFCIATAKKWAIITSVGFSIYLLAQVAVHDINGTYLPIYINYDWIFAPSKRPALINLATGAYKYVFRPSSMFLEPSHFALYIVPAVVFLLDSVSVKNKKGDIMRWAALIIIAVAVVLSTSAGGIMCIGILAVYYVLFVAGINKRNVQYILISLIIAGIVFSTEYAEHMLLRLSTGSSSDQRIFRGFVIFKEFDIWTKLIGTGLNNIGNYMRLHGISTEFDESNLEMMSSLMNTLVAGGILTCVCFIICVIWFFKKAQSPLCKMAVLAFCLLSIYDVTLNSYRGAFLLLIFFSTLCQQRNQAQNSTDTDHTAESISVVKLRDRKTCL